MTSWQENLTSRGARLSHIFQTGNMSDVTFIVGDEKQQRSFKLHKFVLSMNSDVFFTMFNGSLPEKDKVRIPDIHPDIFEIAMKYVYEDSFPVQSMEQAMGTYAVAEKYNIADLRKLCLTYITENLCPKNISILYAMPNLLEALQLKSKCQAMLSERTSEILKSDTFINSPLDMVKDILQLDKLDIENEVELFDFVINWAKSSSLQTTASPKKALRSLMENFLPHIRFLAMSVQEFLSGPVNSGILTDSEIASISENLVVSGQRALPHWCNKGKSRNLTRSFQLIENHVCKFDSTYLDSFSCEIFLTRGSMKFRGFNLYVSPKDSHSTFAPLSPRPLVHIDGVLVNYKEIISSYDPKTEQVKCTFLKPLVLKSSDTVDPVRKTLSCSISHCI